MQKIKLLDNNFISDLGSSKESPPQHFVWDRSSGSSDLVVFTDNCLALADLSMHKKACKVALVFEPYPINPLPYKYLAQNFQKFDLILSHNREFVQQLGKRGEWFENCMVTVNKKHWKKHDKTKFMSIIVSNKTMTQDHMFRHELVKAIKDNNLSVDIYGRGINTLEDKADGLNPYKFSIALENCQIDEYVSDKIYDLFVTNCLPVYRGCNASKKKFNNDGVFHFQTIEDCIRLIKALEKDQDAIYYNKAQQAMEDNFNWTMGHLSAEDHIYEIFKSKGLI